MTDINLPNTVDELRTALLEAGEDQQTVASMKKGDLKTRLIEITTQKMEFDLESIEIETSPCQTLEGTIGIKYGSDKWNNYIMGLFKPDELMDGYPKINGLRRVANLVLGDIVSSKAVDVFVTHGDTKSVVVNYEIQIEWKLDTPVGFGNLSDSSQVRTFGGLADCNEDLSSVFGRHASATAESKSEGRALRKALALNVIAAEEMLTGSIEDASPKARATSPITKPLQDVIIAKSDALNLNLSEVIKKWSGKDNVGLLDLTVEQGRDLFQFINSYQQEKKK